MAEIVFVNIPQETVNDVSVRLLSWKMASGTAVEKDQVLCEVETSKAVMDIEAPVAGVVVYSAKENSEVPVGDTICQIVPAGMTPMPMASKNGTASTNGASAANGNGAHPPVAPPPVPVSLASVSAAAAPVPASAPIPEAVTVPPDSDLRVARLTPLAAKLAAEFGFAKESFPRGSLVRRDDVLRKAGKLPPEPVAKPAAAPVAKAAAANEPVENAPVPGVGVEWTDLPRRKIFEGRVLGQGQARTVQSSVTCSARAFNLRSKLESQGLTLGALVIFEASRLLRKYPVFNAIYDRGRMGHYTSINVGWALDGGDGLMVPVIPAADEKTPQAIAETMQSQIDSYIEGKLSPTDFLGGTFTISDLSADGITHFHPLISQGQSAILGIGGETGPSGNETLYLTLAFDHQLAEGRKAAQFVRELASRLEAHGAPSIVLTQAPTPEQGSGGEAYCMLCMRSGSALLKTNEMLVKSEVPAGFVCSLCLAGFS